MTFDAIERSRYKGRPTNLFLIRYGESAAAHYAYTDCERPIWHQGIQYVPIAITRGKINVTGTMDKQALEVRCTRNVPMAELFRVFPPSRVVNITIFQGHVSDPDGEYIAAWTGRVVSSQRNEKEVVLTCEPVSTSMKRVGLRRHYQYSCPHVLYGEHCRANKEAAKTIITINAIKDLLITPIGGWATPERAKKFLGGLMEWRNSYGDTEVRGIIKVSADGGSFMVNGVLRDLSVGDEVNLFLGCNRSAKFLAGGGLHEDTDCHFLHNNMQNFGGCPFIPKKNPVGFLNHYY